MIHVNIIDIIHLILCIFTHQSVGCDLLFISERNHQNKLRYGDPRHSMDSDISIRTRILQQTVSAYIMLLCPALDRGVEVLVAVQQS
jgi:hypothetical protein